MDPLRMCFRLFLSLGCEVTICRMLLRIVRDVGIHESQLLALDWVPYHKTLRVVS